MFSALSYYTMPAWIKGGPLCNLNKRLEGQVALVTGSNSGIGKEISGELARRGCKVYMASRNIDRLNTAREELLRMYNEENFDKININSEEVKKCYTEVKEEQLIPIQCDLSLMESVYNLSEEFAKKEEKLDIIVCNAGIAGLKNFSKTKEDLEVQFATNHLGHVLLVELLYEQIKKSTSPRLIFVSAWGHIYGRTDWNNLERNEQNYTMIGPYTDSKLGNVIYAKYLAEKLKPINAVTASLHPGVVKTEIFRNVSGLTKLSFKCLNVFGITPWEGSQTALFTILSDNIVSGGFYMQSVIKEPLEIVNDMKSNETMIQKSLELICRTSCANNFKERLQKYL